MMYATGKFTYPELAYKFRITPQTIGKIVRRESWIEDDYSPPEPPPDEDIGVSPDEYAAGQRALVDKFGPPKDSPEYRAQMEQIEQSRLDAIREKAVRQVARARATIPDDDAEQIVKDFGEKKL